jgi:hypothetical protein
MNCWMCVLHSNPAAQENTKWVRRLSLLGAHLHSLDFSINLLLWALILRAIDSIYPLRNKNIAVIVNPAISPLSSSNINGATIINAAYRSV